MRSRLSVIIPAYNEAQRLHETLTAVESIPCLEEVIVIDDGSDDETAWLARRQGASVIRFPQNQGKGLAMSHGASLSRGDILAFLDGDLGESAREVVKLLEPVQADLADMSISVFPRDLRGGGFGLTRGLARWGIRALTGQVMRAPLSGQRVLTRRLYRELGHCAAGFGAEVGLTIDALRLGYRLAEVPTEMSHRITQRNLTGFAHRGRQFYDVASALGRRLNRKGSMDALPPHL